MTRILSYLLLCGAIAAAPMKVSMISLGVTNMDRSVRFYSETLGLVVMGKPGEVTMLKAGEVTIVLNRPLGRSAGERLVGAVEIIFPADSVEKVHEELRTRGCNFTVAPHEVTTGLWAATFTDPDGHRLTILGPH